MDDTLRKNTRHRINVSSVPRLDPRREAAFYDLFQSALNLETKRPDAFPAGAYALERMQPLAALMGHPENNTRVIHVAGTKGKGTTCFYLAALLHSAGFSCGTFTSPHLRTVRERFLINGEPVNYQVLLKHATALAHAIGQADIEPTFFEIITVLGLKIFADAGCAYTVLETGIGGARDATNFIPDPVCAVITSVSRDHTALLGNTIAEIAEQKAGIIKKGTPAVIGPQRFAEAENILARTALLHQADTHLVNVSVNRLKMWGMAEAPPFLKENFCTALTVCDVLGIKPEPGVFQAPAVPGRFEILRMEPLFLSDAAHNADSAERLAEGLVSRFPRKKFTVVVGVVGDKDVKGILQALQRLPARFIFIHPDAPAERGSQLDTLCYLAANMGLAWEKKSSVRSCEDLPLDDDIVFTGSFFTAAVGAWLAECLAQESN